MNPLIQTRYLSLRRVHELGLYPILLTVVGFWALLPWTDVAFPISLCLSGSDALNKVAISGTVLISNGMALGTLLHWTTMAGAMMLPLLAPAAKQVRVLKIMQGQVRAQVMLIVGFLAIWSLFGFGLFLLMLTAMIWNGSAPWLSGFVTCCAVLWQLSMQRTSLIQRCRTSPPLRHEGFAANIDCLRYGMMEALACSRTCLPAMYAMSLSPIGHLAAVPMTWLMLKERSSNRFADFRMVTLLFLLFSAWCLPTSILSSSRH